MPKTCRTKAQLEEELQRLREGSARAAALAEEHEQTERALRERVKELHCLYGISHLAQNRDLTMEELIRQVGELVVASWQYPESACARICLGELTIPTRNFRKSLWRQASPIRIQDERIGEIEVCYLETRPQCDEGPFLREERHLIDAVAEKLGQIIQAKRSEAHLRALSRELIKAQETERLRIATELHDHLAQDLASLKLDLGGLLEAGGELPSLEDRVQNLTERIAGAIATTRDLAYDLLPPGLEDLGLVRTLARYCGDFAQRSGLAVEFYADGVDGLRLGFETQINLYRLVQEALTNARRHARATRVVVRIIGSHPNVILRMEDDGCGVDLEHRLDEFYEAKKMGLWGMRERARLLGGHISLRSSPGKGMRIHIEVPTEYRPDEE